MFRFDSSWFKLFVVKVGLLVRSSSKSVYIWFNFYFDDRSVEGPILVFLRKKKKNYQSWHERDSIKSYWDEVDGII